MVKCVNGILEFKGSTACICAEVSTILISLRELLQENIPDDSAEKLFNDVIEMSKKSDEEIKEATENQLNDLLKSLLKGLLND